MFPLWRRFPRLTTLDLAPKAPLGPLGRPSAKAPTAIEANSGTRWDGEASVLATHKENDETTSLRKNLHGCLDASDGLHCGPTVLASRGGQSRQKWEYQIVGSGFVGSGQVDKLNKLGEEGWEVVTLNASNRVLLRRAK